MPSKYSLNNRKYIFNKLIRQAMGDEDPKSWHHELTEKSEQDALRNKNLRDSLHDYLVRDEVRRENIESVREMDESRYSPQILPDFDPATYRVERTTVDEFEPSEEFPDPSLITEIKDPHRQYESVDDPGLKNRLNEYIDIISFADNYKEIVEIINNIIDNKSRFNAVQELLNLRKKLQENYQKVNNFNKKENMKKALKEINFKLSEFKGEL